MGRLSSELSSVNYTFVSTLPTFPPFPIAIEQGSDMKDLLPKIFVAPRSGFPTV